MNAMSNTPRCAKGAHRRMRAAACAALLCTLTGRLAPVDAAIIAGGPTIPAPTSVDAYPSYSGVCPDGATNTSQVAFVERQNVLLTTDLEVDDGYIPAGKRVSSHMIFLNPGGSATDLLFDAWCFDGPILGVMSDSSGDLEEASSFLGHPGTCYPGAFPARGLEETVGDNYHVDGNKIKVWMKVTAPGDWIRVVTARESAVGITFSISKNGPTLDEIDPFYGKPISAADILTVGEPLFRLPNMASAGAPTPGVLVSAEDLGLLMADANVNALSYGEDRGDCFRFSVDDGAIGRGGTDLSDEAACECLPSVSPCGCLVPTECAASADVFSARRVGGAATATAFLEGADLGLIDIPHLPGSGEGDNLDALDVRTTTRALGQRIYYSVARSPTVKVINRCYEASPRVYASAADLALTVGDDVDALALWDDGDGVFEPLVDKIFFSVARNSSIIGSFDCDRGIQIREGHIMTTRQQASCVPGATTPAIVMSYPELGLCGDLDFAFDELNALDLTPGSLTYGDSDGDDDVDLDDYAGFADCMAGADTEPQPTQPATVLDCLYVFDADFDGDIDLDDLAEFQSAFGG